MTTPAAFPANAAHSLSTLVALTDPASADGHLLAQLAAQENAVLLTETSALKEWLAHHRGNFILLAAANVCLPALHASLAHHEHCLGAFLLAPEGPLSEARPLPFPSLTICHPRHISQPRLTSTVAFANYWGSRLHTLSASPDQTLGELRLLLRALREHTEGWPQGRL